MSHIKVMSDKEYFASPALDQSALKRFMVSPLAYRSYMIDGLDVSRSALDFGSALHSMVLGRGPDVVLKPNMRTKEGKAAAARLEESGAVMLSFSDMEKADDMAPLCRDYIRSIPGQPEMALFATDPATGIRLKGKADWLPSRVDGDGVYRIRDYKTTAGSAREFPRTAVNFGYHIQAAFYLRLARLSGITSELGFEFVVQEKARPYDWAVWRFAEDSPEIHIASDLISGALDDLAFLVAVHGSDWWRDGADGYDKSPHEIEFPKWALDREEAKIWTSEVDPWAAN
ncbi:MAG: PD-(D/E)XK nuclease-like domain-containing protein [Bifidobacteriaceae bacterium]|jgi:hypothetical protein|nr:PD-(D/E)XK nuclease-like domain-containing protein [Bifidobacteriaceae bacterium]